MIDMIIVISGLALSVEARGQPPAPEREVELLADEALSAVAEPPRFVSAPVIQQSRDGEEIETPDTVLPPVIPETFDSNCDDMPGPCVRVMGQPGEEFWVIPEDTFRYWRRELSPPGATVERQIELASSYGFRNWDTERVGSDGYAIPNIGEAGIDYYVVTKCLDNEPGGNFRYRAKSIVRLSGDGEKRARLRCKL